LNLLADWGTAGGVIVLAGLGIFIFSLARTWPHVRREENDFGSGQSNRFAFFLGATGGLFALAAHSTMDFDLHIPANALVGVTLLALLASHLRFATERFWSRAGLPVKFVLTGVLIAGAVYFVAQARRLGGEARWLARAEQLENFSPERAAELEKAFASEPQNFQTAYDIGECFRTQSLNGGDNYTALARLAMDWYARAIQDNPYDAYSYLRTGMCLDWLGRHAEAENYFNQAEARDPNGYFLVANVGWHFVQTGDYAAARQCFIRSLKLGNNNPIAQNYLGISTSKLAEQASGLARLPSNF
jgi:tetratricopeptide (TPR) repeat protein